MTELIGDICYPKEFVMPTDEGLPTTANGTISGQMFISGNKLYVNTGVAISGVMLN